MMILTIINENLHITIPLEQ